MRYRLKPSRITALALLLVIAVAAIGLGYALWFKTLTISSTVTTGDVNAEWVGPPISFCNDPPGQIDPFYDKDIGSTTLTLDAVDPQIIHMDIENGYPSYLVSCHFRFLYLGSIPAKVQGWEIIPDPPLVLASCNGCNDGQLFVDWIDGCGAQLEKSDKQESSADVHVEQQAEQDFTYSFAIKVKLVQWNEFDPALCP